MTSFSLGRLPRVELGQGRIELLPDLVARQGRHALLVTGAGSFRRTPRWGWLLAALDARGLRVDDLVVPGEPSPALIDEAVALLRPAGLDVVVGIGGGSVLDAAKAVAGLLPSGRSVMDHLEVVGRGLPFEGPALPFVAVPTTAGTGSEATKNAVITGRLPGASRNDPPFKKSFRDDRLVASVALLDPDLLASCPPAVIAGDGMDALTQLLESFTSTGASPFSDAVARSGLAAIGRSLPTWHAAALDEAAAEETAAARNAMAWAALCSGIALANAGLGAVHGLVAPLGARFGIPHGRGCGALLAATTRVNLAALRDGRRGSRALERYAEAGRLLAGDPAPAGGALTDEAARDALLATLDRLTVVLRIPRLATSGVTAAAFPALVAESRGTSMRTNPVVLTDGEVGEILAASL